MDPVGLTEMALMPKDAPMGRVTKAALDTVNLHVLARKSVIEIEKSVAADKVAIRMDERMGATECMMVPSATESEREPSPGGCDTWQGKHEHRDQQDSCDYGVNASPLHFFPLRRIARAAACA